MKKHTRQILPTLFFLLFLTGCEDFLDVKPTTDLVVPDNLEDLRALLDNDVTVMGRDPALQLVASDDFYIRENQIGNLNESYRNTYLFQNNPQENDAQGEWQLPFQQIFYANVVLDEIHKIEVKPHERLEWNSLKGSALFYRAYNYFNLACIFSMPYPAEESPSLLGIPLRLSANVNIRSERSDLQTTFDQILKDLQEALTLLPEVPDVRSRPSKHAVNAFLSRVYLYMHDYENAKKFAEETLRYDDSLLDYSKLNDGISRPFQRLNQEVIFNAYLMTHTILSNSPGSVSKELIHLYAENDLRKKMFFTAPNALGDIQFKGTYMGDLRLFSGLANDEMYLILAETAARLGKTEQALTAINRLLEHRYEKDTFEPIQLENSVELVRFILEERRKQLVHRGQRWADIKRLSVDQDFAVELQKTVNGVNYGLTNNDPRLAFPIPNNEILLSGITQNPR